MGHKALLVAQDHGMVLFFQKVNIRVHNNKIVEKFINKDHGVKYNPDRLLSDVRSIVPSGWDSMTMLQKNQFLEMKTLLSGYLLSSQGDRSSLAHGVEGRYPYLDHRVVEKVFSYTVVIPLNN